MDRWFEVGGQQIYIKELILSGELGTQIWDATFVMFRYMETELEQYKGKRILELGAGTGILGVAAAKLGAKEVVVTDLPELVGIMEENVRLNDLPNCRAAALTWGDDPAPFNPPFDIILLADVITEMYSAHYPKLVQTLKDMSNEKTRIILGFEKRLRNKEVEFFTMLLNHDFVHTLVEDAWKWDPTYESETRMTIFNIKRKPITDTTETKESE